MIRLNGLIQRNSEGDKGPITFRVIALDRSEDIVVTFDINDKNALPVIESYKALVEDLAKGIAKIVQQDPYISFIKVKDSDLKPSHIDRREQAFSAIENLVTHHKWELFYSSTRGRLIWQAAHQHIKTYEQVLYWLRLYWRKCMHRNALLPDYQRTGCKGQPKSSSAKKRGRRTELEKHTGQRIGINITEDVAIKLGKGYRTYYLKSEGKHSEEKAYLMTLRRWFRKGGRKGKHEDLPAKDQLPSIFQFRYWGRKYTPSSEQVRLKSGKSYPLTKRPRIFTTVKLYYGPGSEFQIDATRYSVYLLSNWDRNRIIGTPVVYIIRDCFSRMIIGFAVTLEGPSWLGAILALETVTIDKVELCKKYGVEIEDWEWPCKHLCHLIKADRGELLSEQALRLVRDLGISKTNTPPFRGDMKGLVENSFRVIEGDTVAWVPGAYVNQPKRKGHDYRLDATMNITEFTRLIIRYILKYNNVKDVEEYQLDPAMLADGVEPIPLDLWNWGIENLSGELRTEDQDFVRFCLLPEGKGSIAREGIYFKKLWYSSMDPRIWEKYIQSLRGRISVQVIYDPRCVDVVSVRLEKRGEPIPCRLKDNYEVYRGYTFEEYSDLLSTQRQLKQRRGDRSLRADIRYQDFVEAEIRNAEKRRSDAVDASLPKSKRISGIKANRKQERTLLRRQSPWLSDGSHETSGAGESEAEEKYIPKHNPHEELRKLRERKMDEQTHRE